MLPGRSRSRRGLPPILAALLLLGPYTAAPRSGAGAATGTDAPPLTPEDEALIEEAFHLQGALGPDIWAEWGPMEAPLLYKAGGWDYLVGHPAPPPRFQPTGRRLLGRQLLAAAATDSNAYLAAFPVEGVWTAVVSRPGPDLGPARWEVLVVHELFHVWQHRVRPDRVVDPFVGPHAGEHELSFPFPYDSGRVRALQRLEGEQVFLACTADSLPPAAARRAVVLLGDAGKLAPGAFDDSLALVYKKWMEWNEGVARYTEREAALRAADPSHYRPLSAFTARFPEADYRDLKDRYDRDLNPVRFVGEGVRGRMTFYYLGMGKAYLLDRVLPGWKGSYFEQNLDALLATAESAPACRVD